MQTYKPRNTTIMMRGSQSLGNEQQKGPQGFTLTPNLTLQEFYCLTLLGLRQGTGDLPCAVFTKTNIACRCGDEAYFLLRQLFFSFLPREKKQNVVDNGRALWEKNLPSFCCHKEMLSLCHDELWFMRKCAVSAERAFPGMTKVN